jgi:ubiquinone/menaquinone biosynthesis C-methylase UbiE
VYDRIAVRYTERNSEMQPYLIESAHMLLTAIEQNDLGGMPVLDLGCGTGRDTAWLVSHGVDMVSLDLSRGMLTEAKKITSSPLLQADMCYLPFGSEAFSAVWCQAALLHLPKALAPIALQEMQRIITPGGLLRVSVQRGETEGYEARAHEPETRYYAHYQMDEFIDLVQMAGFQALAQGEVEERRSWLWVMAMKR